jgi:hydroxymethylpyrimidine pyrophosphatase-like HAD family hydrolase
VIRLVASDVDGTLLDHHGVLPPPRAAAVRALTAAGGIPLVLATGKLWTSVRCSPTISPSPDRTWPATGRSCSTPTGRILHTTLLDGAVADEVTAVLRARRIPTRVYLEDGTLVTDAVDAAHDVLPVLGEPLPVVAGTGRPRRPQGPRDPPPDAEATSEALASDVARVQRTGPRFLEWNAAGADKATGLATVARCSASPSTTCSPSGTRRTTCRCCARPARGRRLRREPTARAAADRTLTGPTSPTCSSPSPRHDRRQPGEEHRMTTTAILLAGGSGTRLGTGDNKAYLTLGGHPLLVWSLVAFERSGAIDDVVLVTRPEDRSRANDVAAAGATKLRAVVDGGRDPTCERACRADRARRRASSRGGSRSSRSTTRHARS